MKTPKKRFLIDILAFISFVFLTSTGVLLFYILPPGSGRGNTIWQLDRHEWGDIHFYFAVSFLVILSYHVIQHWRWILSLVKGKQRSYSRNRIALGLVGLLALIAIAIAPVITPVEKTENGGQEMEHSSGKEEVGVIIEGSMTLADIEQNIGVPAAYILRELDLPLSISIEEKLGQLKATYNFSMDDVREIVSEYDPTK